MLRNLLLGMATAGALLAPGIQSASAQISGNNPPGVDQRYGGQSAPPPNAGPPPNMDRGDRGRGPDRPDRGGGGGGNWDRGGGGGGGNWDRNDRGRGWDRGRDWDRGRGPGWRGDYGPPPYRYGPPPRGPRCFYRPERVWDGWNWVIRERRICR